MIRGGTMNFRGSAAQFSLGNIALGHPGISHGFAPSCIDGPSPTGTSKEND